MTSADPHSPAKRTWLKTGLAVILFVAFVIVLFVPHYRSEIATVDGSYRWLEKQAPIRREVIWQPAETLISDNSDSQRSESQRRPQLTTNGNDLYYAVRTENHFDIVRSQRLDDGWSAPEPIAELNSPADDFAPIFDPNGADLYLYSNREGGFGGMDLYVSKRQGDRWSKPINLGSTINSPADEKDPAITTDGLRFSFSSNRGKSVWNSKEGQWPPGLPKDWINRKFDLYEAWNESNTNSWSSVKPMSWLNTPEFNETAPCFSPDGAFIFFASDRPTHPGVEPNYDLFRSPIERPDLPPENLGAGVNTLADETDPCLTAAGFQLLFTRSADNNRRQYVLQQSTAKEVYQDHRWDPSNWQSVTGTLSGLSRGMIHPWWSFLLTGGAVILLIWLIRQLTASEVAISGFLGVALLLHILLLSGSFFVYFQQSITHKLKQILQEELVVATQILSESPSATDVEQPKFDQVAELHMPVSVQSTEVTRQSLASVELQPIELAKPLPITRNVPLHVEGTGDLVVAFQDVRLEKSETLRRAVVRPTIPLEDVRFEQTRAVESPAMNSLPSKATEVDRKKLPSPDNLIEPVALEVTNNKLPLSQDNLNELELRPREEPTIAVTKVAVELDRRISDHALGASLVYTPSPNEKIAAVTIQQTPTPASQRMEQPRVAEMLAATFPQLEPLKLAKSSEAAPPPLISESLDPIIADTKKDVLSPSTITALPLSRSVAEIRLAATDAEVPTEAVKMVVAPTELSTTSSVGKVDIARMETKQQPMEVNALTMKIENHQAANPTPESASPEPVVRMAAIGIETTPRAKANDGLLPRRSAKSKLEYADSKVNLQSLLMRRNLDEATKTEIVKDFGGNDQTLTAIRRGLTWIGKHQAVDGHWGFHNFHEQCKDHPHCDGHGSSRSDTAATALAILPFLGDGNTHQQGAYQEAVARGISWLVKNQKPDGNLFTDGEGNAFMYSHGIATIALCECYGMTGDLSLRQSAQRAVDFIVAAQDPKSGGWRYKPREAADTSVVGWQVMALKSAQMAELNVPEKSLQEAQRWLLSVAGQQQNLGKFAYQGQQYNPAMTAEALLCLEYLDTKYESEHLTHGTSFLLANLPQKGRETSYYWYYGTQAMFHLQGDPWQQWNAAIHPLLIETQRIDGAMAGTWDAKDQWENAGGRIYATSLRILMLEVYYRHLPIYQVIR